MIGSLFHSFMVAQVLGLYMLITAIILLSRANYYKELIQQLEYNNVAIWISASISLMLGIFLVIIHNIWVLEPRLLVTIICWIILIKSVLWLAIPEKMLELTKRCYSGSGYYITLVIMVIIGILILTKGFYLFM